MGIENDVAEGAVDPVERYRLFFDNVPEAVFVVAVDDLRLLEANRAAVDKYGFAHDELRKMKLADLHPSWDAGRADSIARAIRSGSCGHVGMAEHVGKDGASFSVDLHVRPIDLPDGPASVMAAIDLSRHREAEQERRLLQDRLWRAQKMESVGRLAGGVAHAFNNILSGILGYADVGIKESGEQEDVRGYFETIRAMVLRASRLTENLLMLGRTGVHRKQLLDVGQAVRQVEELLSWTIEENIQVVLDLADDLPAIVGQPEQVEQLVVNLCVNARDAIEGSGVIRIETRHVEAEKAQGAHDFDSVAGFVRLRIEDTGRGLPEEMRERLFEPFFKTKEGTDEGLGLAVVYGIVREHGGYITVDSSPERGTRFDIFLPVASDEATEADQVGTEGPGEGKATVLLVDDDALVRRTGALLLKKLGYNVVTAESGERALAECKRQERRIDVVVLDLVMPGMGGTETYRRIEELNLDAKVVFCTGYSSDERVITMAEQEGCQILRKPFLMSSLQAAIQNCMR